MEFLSELSIARKRARRTIIVAIRRSFRLDEDSIRDQVMEGLRRDVDALAGLLHENAKQHKQELQVTREIQARLEWHEIKGPLAESKAKLDKTRNKGIITLASRNGH